MDCLSSTTERSYGSFSEQLHARAARARIPVNGTLEVTARCNLRCVHCYLPVSQRANLQEDELSLGEIQRIFNEIADAGCLWLLLTGGEPLLRRDFFEIYRSARQKGFIVTLFTNGTLITEKSADFLAEWRPFEIEITLYGATQTTYERVTGVPGSYARCMRGIELLQQRNLPLRLKSMVMTLNQHELEEMKHLCQGLGVGFVFDAMINPAIDGDPRPLLYRLSTTEIVEMEREDSKKAAAWKKALANTTSNNVNSRKMYMCGAGLTSFHIDSSGRLSMCTSARHPGYDLRKGTFVEGWQSFLAQVRNGEYSQGFKCLGCELRMVCPQCPAMGLMECGDTEAQVPFLCEVTHLRHEVFGIKQEYQIDRN